MRAAGAVQPIRQPARCSWLTGTARTHPVQQQLDDQRVLLESLSDEFDASTLLDVDDALSFRRPGIGTDVTRKLRKGDGASSAAGPARPAPRRCPRRRWPPSSATRTARACAACAWCMARAWAHPAGAGAQGKVHSWLIQKDEVLAFVQARADEAVPARWWCCSKPG